MYEINAAYESYYTETDAKKRFRLLEAFKEAGREPTELSAMEHIRAQRYDTKKKEIADRFLMQCLNFSYLYKSQSPASFFAERKFNNALHTLMLLPEQNREAVPEALLYHEYRNTALCYLKTCESGSYRSILGVIQADDTSRLMQIATDIREMTTGIAQRFGALDTMALWNTAVQDAFFSSYEEAKTLLS